MLSSKVCTCMLANQLYNSSKGFLTRNNLQDTVLLFRLLALAWLTFVQCIFDLHALFYTCITCIVTSCQYIDIGIIKPVNVCSNLIGDVQIPLSYFTCLVIEQLWPKAVHCQTRAKQLLVRIRWVVGRELVGASVNSIVLSTQGSLCCANESTTVLAPDSGDIR